MGGLQHKLGRYEGATNSFCFCTSIGFVLGRRVSLLSCQGRLATLFRQCILGRRCWMTSVFFGTSEVTSSSFQVAFDDSQNTSLHFWGN